MKVKKALKSESLAHMLKSSVKQVIKQSFKNHEEDTVYQIFMELLEKICRIIRWVKTVK